MNQTNALKKLLIANRGEIACRIMRTTQRLGIQSVAVYSRADAGAMHVQSADQAVLIGEATARESYLQVERILSAARETGAQAIHPGYGFLSENAEFARAVQAQGLIWVGPPVSAIEAMGHKSASKRIMQEAGVPVVPGYHGERQDDDFLHKTADEQVGYPLLIKAVLGGGGKGMRIAHSSGEFREALASARREARNSFGDDRVLIERYITRPRHVELQVFADKHGNCVHLFERDCSVQRRHQKVLEEAPAPALEESLRARMGAAAVAAARAVGYEGAGTVEFILDCDSDEFFFMEMNTRLQVEHPVTEMITGQDLVDWQLRVAMGLPLPCTQDELKVHGHAFEARIYAENPARGFLPGAGPLRWLQTPKESPSVRVETGVRQGDEVSIFYDPMIAKLVVHGEDRARALQAMRAALAEFRVAGLPTNIEFLQSLAAHPEFEAAHVDTGFIARHMDALFPRRTPPPEALAMAASRMVSLDASLASAKNRTDFGASWRSLAPARKTVQICVKSPYEGEEDQIVQATVFSRCDEAFWKTCKFPPAAAGADIRAPGTTAVQIDGWTYVVDDRAEDDVRINGAKAASARLLPGPKAGFDYALFFDGHHYELEVPQPTYAHHDLGKAGAIHAPMPGQVTNVLVKVGDAVKKGDPLVVMIAMKMEHTIRSPIDGVVSSLNSAPNDQVKDQQTLIVVDAP